MPSETEELRLRVVLDDEASAGLNALKNSVQQLTTGGTAANLGRFTRQQKELGKSIKDLTELAVGGERAMQNFVRGFGAAGVAASALSAVVLGTAQRLAQLGDAAKLIGGSGPQFKALEDSLTRVGLTVQEADESIQGMNASIVEMGRVGSQLRAHMIQMAGAHSQAMIETLNKAQQAHTYQAQMRVELEAAALIEKNRYEQLMRQGKDEIDQEAVKVRAARDAAALRNQWLREQHINEKAALLDPKDLQDLSAAQDKYYDNMIKRSQEATQAWRDLSKSASDFGDVMTAVFAGPMAQGLRDTAREIGTIDKALETMTEKWRGGIGGLGLLPGTLTPTQQPATPTPGKGYLPGVETFRRWIGSEPAPGPGTPLQFGGGGVGNMFGRTDWSKFEREARPSTMIEDARDHTKTLDENTAQLKKLNDALFLLEQGDIRMPGVGGAGGMGGGGRGVGGGGAPGGGGGYSTGTGGGGGGISTGGGAPPYGSSVGPGSGAGAGGTAPFGMPSSGVLGDPNAGLFGTPSRGVLGGGGGGGGGAGGAPAGPLGAGPGGRVDPSAFYSKAVEAFRNSPLKGFVPKDGARWGIKTGAPEEWARLATATAQQESGMRANAPGGGLLQMSAGDLARYGAHGAVGDPNAQLQGMVNQWSQYIPKAGVVSAPASGPGSYSGWGGAGAYFGSLRYGPGSGHGAEPDVGKYLKPGGFADVAAAGGVRNSQAMEQPAAPSSGSAPAPGAVTAVGGVPPAAFIMHHTGGRGDVAGVQATLRGRGLGVEYVMDRQGNIVRTGGPGAANIGPESMYRKSPILGPGHPFLSNKNIVGMEVIAKDDRDVTPEQVAAAKKFIAENYPGTPVFGHGEVNPGHKEATEGATITSAIRADRAAADRGIIDNKSIRTVKVEGSGKLTANINAPPGTDVTLGGTGLFKQTQLNKQVQMAPARPAAGMDRGAASVPGGGTAL